MKEVTIGQHELLLVKVPENSSDFKVNRDGHGNYVEFETIMDEDDPGTYDCMSIRDGQWTLLGLCPDIKEEVWRGIVEDEGFWKAYNRTKYTDYLNVDVVCDTAIESAQSLISREGYTWETTLVLIQDKK